VKVILRRKVFRFTLVVLLFAACIYPPFLLMTEGGITMGRKWDWILTLPTPREVPRIDLTMLFGEAIIAILIAIGVSLIVLGIGKVSGQGMRFHSRARKPTTVAAEGDTLKTNQGKGTNFT
jgi:hypothetical protein